jgi:hypothetical protein
VRHQPTRPAGHGGVVVGETQLSQRVHRLPRGEGVGLGLGVEAVAPVGVLPLAQVPREGAHHRLARLRAGREQAEHGVVHVHGVGHGAVAERAGLALEPRLGAAHRGQPALVGRARVGLSPCLQRLRRGLERPCHHGEARVVGGLRAVAALVLDELLGDREQVVAELVAADLVVAREGRAAEGPGARGHARPPDAEPAGLAVAAAHVEEPAAHLGEGVGVDVVLVCAADGERLEGHGLHVAAVAVVRALPLGRLAADEREAALRRRAGRGVARVMGRGRAALGSRARGEGLRRGARVGRAGRHDAPARRDEPRSRGAVARHHRERAQRAPPRER